MNKQILKNSVAVASLLMASSAIASDYNTNLASKTPGEIYTPVEFGDGWYIRGDISFNLKGRNESGSQFVTRLNGDVKAYYNDVLGYRVGLGFVFNPSFRMDLTAEATLKSRFEDLNFVQLAGTRTDTNTDGTTTTVPVTDIPGTEQIKANYNSYNMMMNVYYDLQSIGAFTPYIGAGIGLSRIEYAETRTMTCTPNGVTVSCGNPVAGGEGESVASTVVLDQKEEKYTHSYQFSLGTAYALSETLALDLGYTYFATGSGPQLNYNDGTAIDVNGYRVHKLNAGLRYELW